MCTERDINGKIDKERIGQFMSVYRRNICQMYTHRYKRRTSCTIQSLIHYSMRGLYHDGERCHLHSELLVGHRRAQVWHFLGGRHRNRMKVCDGTADWYNKFSQ